MGSRNVEGSRARFATDTGTDNEIVNDNFVGVEVAIGVPINPAEDMAFLVVGRPADVDAFGFPGGKGDAVGKHYAVLIINTVVVIAICLSTMLASGLGINQATQAGLQHTGISIVDDVADVSVRIRSISVVSSNNGAHNVDVNDARQYVRLTIEPGVTG